MAKLILSLDGLVLKDIPLLKERLTIGRKPHNDLQIENLAVSGEHALVVTLQNESFLEDLDSTNGTLVNGQPVKKHALRNNDVIEIGKYKLKYISDVALVGGSPADYDKTMILRPGQLPPEGGGKGAGDTQPPAAPPQENAGPPPVFSTPSGGGNGAAGSLGRSTPSLPPASSLPRAAIQVLTGANAGKELELVKSLTSLGKPGVQVAVIARRPQGYFITHVEGGRFPVLNGKVLNAQAHPLNDHDVIEIAGVKMEFFFKL